MEGGALLTPEFNEFSKKHVMFLHVTTRIEGRKDEDLFNKVGGRGFPSFFVLDSDGKVVAQHEGPRTAAAFAETIDKAKEFVTLRDKAKAGDAAAKVDYLFARVRMGQLSADEMKAEAKSLKMSDEQQKTYRGLLANVMMDDEQTKAVGKAFVEMQKNGYVPEDGRKQQAFYLAIFRYGNLLGDAAMMDGACNGLEKVWAGNPNGMQYLDTLRKEVEKAKEKAKEKENQ